MSNKTADEGNLFVCCACGKASTTAYGFDADNRSTASRGWDESCMLNAREFPISLLVWNADKTRVVEVKNPEPQLEALDVATSTPFKDRP